MIIGRESEEGKRSEVTKEVNLVEKETDEGGRSKGRRLYSEKERSLQEGEEKVYKGGKNISKFKGVL